MQIPDKKALDKLKTDLTEREMATYLATRFGSNDPFFSATAINYMATALEAARTLSALYDAIGEDAVRGLLEGAWAATPVVPTGVMQVAGHERTCTALENGTVATCADVYDAMLSARPKKGE